MIDMRSFLILRRLLPFAFGTLTGAVLIASAASTRTDASPRTVNVPLAITLKLRDPSGLARLIDAQSDPRSPQYAHFLTPAQFRDAFAPTAATYAATLVTLRREGFSIDRTWPNRTFINVSAPAAIVAHAFAATLSMTAGPAGPRYVAATAFRIPAELADVSAVVGAQPVAARTATPMLSGAQARARTVGTSFTGPDGGYSPQALTTAYDFPVLHGFDGSGVIVADTTDNSDIDSNVDTYLKTFGITRRVPVTTVIGAGGYRDTVQPDLDAEGVLGVAPGVNYYIYDTTFLINEYIVSMFAKLVTDNIVDVVNTSFSVCELNDPVVLALQPILAQGAAQGIAFEGAQFGSPSTCGVSGVDPIEYPGGDAHSVAVGGSNLVVDAYGTLIAQSALPQTGGGVSLYNPLPAYQAKIPGINPAGRNTPDLVTPGEINSVGPSAYLTSTDPFSGQTITGWQGAFPFVDNAPFAGLLAEIQQMVHHRLGVFNKTLYALYAADGYGLVFRDISSGCDGFVGSSPLCAHAGYDVSSGIGSVDGYGLGLQFH